VTNRLRKSPQADLDLDSIWNFIAADDPHAAERQIDRIGKIFQMLIENPRAGRERFELRKTCAVSLSALTSSFMCRSQAASKSSA
jgi:plasmid stabilization system protein ParE